MGMTASKNTPTAMSVVEGKDLSGKTILITGGYGGLGAESAKALLSIGATVIVAGRTQSKIDKFIESNQTEDKRLFGYLVDLGDLTTIKPFAKLIEENHPTIDILINNAGVMACPASETKQGFETQVGINGIGTVALTEVLIPRLKSSKKGRIINLSSYGHKWKPHAVPWNSNSFKLDKSTYKPFKAYQQAKLSNILHIRALSRVHPDLEMCAVHPGFIPGTDLGRHGGFGLSMEAMRNVGAVMKQKQKNVPQGASTQTFCAVQDTIEQGAYYRDCAVHDAAPYASIEADQDSFYNDALKHCEQYI